MKARTKQLRRPETTEIWQPTYYDGAPHSESSQEEGLILRSEPASLLCIGSSWTVYGNTLHIDPRPSQRARERAGEGAYYFAVLTQLEGPDEMNNGSAKRRKFANQPEVVGHKTAKIVDKEQREPWNIGTFD